MEEDEEEELLPEDDEWISDEEPYVGVLDLSYSSLANVVESHKLAKVKRKMMKNMEEPRRERLCPLRSL